MMLVHGIFSKSMLLGTMVPIAKNKKKSLCDSDNYRAFDWVILLKEKDALCFSDMQFGFKEAT